MDAGALVRAGTLRYGKAERPGLMIANITGYLATLSSLGFAATFAFRGDLALWPLVVGNLLSAACTAITPLFHRLGPLAAALWLATVFFSSLIYFTSLMGRESGVILNLIGTSAVAFAILGPRRIGMVAAITLVSAALILLGWFRYSVPAPGIAEDPAFNRRLFATSILSIMAIIFVVSFYAHDLAARAQQRTDHLLRSIMPAQIVDRLTENPGVTIAERHERAAVLLADIVGFTELSNRLGPERIVLLLDSLFRDFDRIAATHRVEKIKTIGDAYMAACGVPVPHRSPEQAILAMAVAMHDATDRVGTANGLHLQVRIGLACGAVTAGVVGQSKYFYDIWGPTVNLAARLQVAAEPGETLIPQTMAEHLAENRCRPEPIGQSVQLKGFGELQVCRLRCRQPRA